MSSFNFARAISLCLTFVSLVSLSTLALGEVLENHGFEIPHGTQEPYSASIFKNVGGGPSSAVGWELWNNSPVNITTRSELVTSTDTIASGGKYMIHVTINARNVMNCGLYQTFKHAHLWKATASIDVHVITGTVSMRLLGAEGHKSFGEAIATPTGKWEHLVIPLTAVIDPTIDIDEIVLYASGNNPEFEADNASVDGVKRPPVDVVTQHNDNARSGAYLTETHLTPATVQSPLFGKLYSRYVAGDVLAQPLYVRNVPINGILKNLFFIATAKNWVYAFDADNLSTNPNTPAIWGRQLAHVRLLRLPGVPEIDKEICNETINGYVGVTSTPVIDLSSQTLYVVAKLWTKRGQADDGTDWLHAIDIRDGAERPGSPQQITAVAPADPSNHFDNIGQSPRQTVQRNRPGLLLLNGVIYVAFGSFSCDSGFFHGWVIGYRYDQGKFTQAGVFCTTSKPGIGIWQSGNGLVGVDQDIYFETGNDFPPPPDPVPPNDPPVTPLANSFVHLRAGGVAGLSIAGKSFTPINAYWLGVGDTDLGSGGPLLLPGDRLIGGGKEGRYYVLDRNLNLQKEFLPFRNTYHRMDDDHKDRYPGHHDSGYLELWKHPRKPHDPYVDPTGKKVTGEYVDPQDYQDGEHYGPNIHAGPIYWQGPTPGHGLIYQMPEKDYLKVFDYNLATGHVNENPVLTSTYRSPDGMPGGFSSLSANDNHDGIVWVSCPDDDAQGQNVAGHLLAFDATNLKLLWTDEENLTFAKFCAPTIADGKVFHATFANQVVVYGLRTSGGQTDPCQGLIDSIAALSNQIDELDQALATGEIPAPPRTPARIAAVQAHISRLRAERRKLENLLMECRKMHP